MTKLGFTGDIALSGIIGNFSEAQITEQLNLGKIAESTVFIINLEAPATSENDVSVKNQGIKLRSSREVLKYFLNINRIAAATLANNHSTDFGPAGLKNTIQILDGFNIPHTGAGLKHQHIEPAIFEVDNKKYALLSYVHPGTHPFTADDVFLNIYNKQEIITAVQNIKNKVDFTILSLHWGKDYSKYPQSWQIKDAHDLIREGADVIAGHHPHVIQPFEYYNERFIFYSLGSTIFGDFYLRDRLRALPIKTKRSFIPVFSNIKEYPEFVSIRELKGNHLVLNSVNVKRWSERTMRRTIVKNRNPIYSFLVNFREKWLDRIIDVLFGYYRNPFKDILSISAVRNALKIIRKKSANQ